MVRMTRFHFHLPAALLVILLISSCARRVPVSEERPLMQGDSPYEVFWVDPQIVVADTLITLFRSERIDSAIVEPSGMTLDRPAAVELRVMQASCSAMVDLLDANLRLVRPLLLKNLSYGYYRLTLNVDRFREPSLPPGRYFLRAEFCGRTEMAMFTTP
jgi:hypothetical protein